MSQRRPLMNCYMLLLVLCALAGPSAQAQARRPAPPPQVTSLHLHWPAQEGVLRYRLQVARDEQFKDIIFDRAVFGSEYLVANLTPGPYYWRVAPAAKETGTYTPPRLVVIAGKTTTDAAETLPTTPTPTPTPFQTANPGWSTTTGMISLPLVAHLRSATGYDLVGVNADGMTYGIDGSNGSALWAARFRPEARRGEPTGSGGAPVFTPLLIDGKNGLANVVVPFEGGVRALEGATGRELWRAKLANHPLHGVVVANEGGGDRRLLITYDKSSALTILNPENGQTVSDIQLDASPVAPPALFPLGQGSGIILSLEGGMIDVRNSMGERVHALKMDTNLTTPPLVVKGPRGILVLVGTENGLISLSADDLKPLGRIATEGDAPSGMLSSADLDGDGAPEVLMITRKGQLAAINTTDGKIKWHTNGATDAAAATFTDLNGDGVLDVLVAAGPDFARGFSGRDGALIWRAQEEAKGGPTTDAPMQARSLVAAPLGEGATVYVVGTDAAHTGLRAVGLPIDSVKAAKE